MAKTSHGYQYKYKKDGELVNLTFDSSELQKNIEEFTKNMLPEMIQKALKETAGIIEGEVKELLTSKIPEEWQDEDEDEEIRKHIFSKVSENAVEVGSDTILAIYCHQGTGLYAVNGDGRKEVPWYWRDQKTKKVKSSSGRNPYPFLTKAVENKTDEILSAFILKQEKHL